METIDIIKFVVTTFIIYFTVIYMVMKTSGEKFVSSVHLLQSMLMTIGALSFIYSYEENRREKVDKIEKLAAEVPLQWSEILNYMKENDHLSPSIKKWVLKGDSENINISTLNLEDLNFIEFVINKTYKIWLIMVEFKIAHPSSTNEYYTKLLRELNTDDKKMLKTFINLFGKLYSPEFILEKLKNESNIYPIGFINFIYFCVEYINLS